MKNTDCREETLASALLDDEAHLSQKPAPIEGVVLGILVGLVDNITPLVSFPGNPNVEAARAKMIAALQAHDIGRQVALLFEGGDPQRPIVVGCIQSPIPTPAAKTETVEAQLDDEQVLLTAKRQLVLRCGKASITLTQAGKVLINGTYIVSRSSGANKIRGGSIDLN